jgi:hypothetical protein
MEGRLEHHQGLIHCHQVLAFGIVDSRSPGVGLSLSLSLSLSIQARSF